MWTEVEKFKKYLEGNACLESKQETFRNILLLELYMGVWERKLPKMTSRDNQISQGIMF